MATVTTNTYPTSDGKPMAETDWHRNLMLVLIQVLKAFYAENSMVYVSGNLLIFYVPGNRRKHLAPDVFVVQGVPNHNRPNYLIWEEGKGPDVVIELTSSSTRAEDVKHKFRLYQDTLKVKEYFLFDPFEDYLEPAMQGYRLRRGVYEPIRPVKGRLPSQVLGLHLERSGSDLRLFDPNTSRWLPTPQEVIAKLSEGMSLAQAALQEEERARRQAESERERLRRELEELRKRLPPAE